MFTRLQTKLTVLYAGLFGLALSLGALAVYAAISSNAKNVVRGELQSSGTVFERVWDLRASELRNGAELLSRDFGFREALASADDATISSAVANLQGRLGADVAMVFNADGAVTAINGPVKPEAAARILSDVEMADDPSGVLTVDGRAYEAIAVPILSPTPMGWVVFAAELDDGEMTALEQLSAIPLEAVVLRRAADGHWQGAQDPAEAKLVAGALEAGKGGSRVLTSHDGKAMVLVKPLHSLDPKAPAVLLLRYPLARALAPYRSLLEMVVGLALLGMILVAAGSWMLSRSLTRPLSALEEAAHRLQRGEEAHVTAETHDEIGRLADSFNAMAAEIRERERRIIHLAHHDPETDLLSRAGMEREIAARTPAPGQVLVMAAIGLDRFVEVRGAIGHALSSTLMAEIGRRLAALNPDCSVGRLATDTLGLLFEAGSLDGALGRADEVHAACLAPLRLQGNTIDVSVTIGLAARGVHADAPAELIERASIALDQSRAARRKASVFDLEVYGDPASNLSLMSEMRQGMSEGHMRVHYQPKLDLRQGIVTGVEALVRWTHPQRGYLPPDSFICMAEETGHIRSLTDWVLDQAIADQKKLAAEGRALEVAINISGRLLGDMDFAESAVDVARGAIGPLCFEITETSVIENPDLALTIIERFSAAGLKVSIDDYGAGFSSLAYLKQIPADELKIDKAFVLQMDESQKDRLLVRSTVDLAHSLGLRVTAEGVETDTSLALLTGMGCDLAQGFGIARPMPLENVIAFLNGEQAPRAKAPQRKARLA